MGTQWRKITNHVDKRDTKKRDTVDRQAHDQDANHLAIVHCREERRREEEEKGVQKQKEELSLAMQSGTEPDWDSDVDNEDYESDVSMQDSEIISEITRSHMSLNDAFGDVFQHSAVPQLIASPGGRIVTCKFVSILETLLFT